MIPSIDTQVKSLLKEKNFHALKFILETWQPSEIAELIAHIPESAQAYVFKTLPESLEEMTFEAMKPYLQKRLLVTLEDDQLKLILNRMPPDNRTALLKRLPKGQVTELFNLLEPEKRKTTQSLMGYPEHSIGRLMTPHYIAVRMEWTIQQVWDYIRIHGKNSETLNVIYVIDDDGNLIDDIMVREILLCTQNQKIGDIMDHKFIALHVEDDQEEAVQLFRKHNRVALPVTDHNKLVGIVTIDDVLRVAREEDTEDIQKFGGSEALDEPYMHVAMASMIKKRAGWLVILFLSEMLTATAMGFFENEIAKAVVLALFVPLIISSGGNSGSQAATLIIRALALGEVHLRDWYRIMRREIIAGFTLGMILGIIGFMRIALWSTFSHMYGPHWMQVAFTVCFSLIGVVLWGTLAGSMLPLILKKCGADPATSSAPFIATLVDVTGLIIYFSVGMVVLRGTLL
jgi:magnesium transporter